MKKVILAMLAIFTVSVNANALSVQRSREEARFLTDKMMYELNLTDDQADDVYEINYDYFRSLGPIDGFYDTYYDRRYEDLSYVLYDWQWDEFLARDYFLRPAYIYRGGWAFGIYNYYTRAHFFYGVPRIFYSYDGGHFRHMEYYRGRFEMHRRAVQRMPRETRRVMGGIRMESRGGMQPRGGMNPGGNSRSMNRSNMGSMNRGGSNMENRNGNPANMNRGNSNMEGMNRDNSNGNMNRSSSSMGNMNRGGNSNSMNRGSSDMGNSMNRSSSNTQRSSSRVESRSNSNNSPSRSFGGNSNNGGSRNNGGGSRRGR